MGLLKNYLLVIWCFFHKAPSLIGASSQIIYKWAGFHSYIMLYYMSNYKRVSAQQFIASPWHSYAEWSIYSTSLLEFQWFLHNSFYVFCNSNSSLRVSGNGQTPNHIKLLVFMSIYVNHMSNLWSFLKPHDIPMVIRQKQKKKKNNVPPAPGPAGERLLEAVELRCCDWPLESLSLCSNGFTNNHSQ